MGFVPADAEWYLAELMQELTVEEGSRNVVWRNLTLVHANSPDEAYEKALSLGPAGDTEYLNPSGKAGDYSFSRYFFYRRNSMMP